MKKKYWVLRMILYLFTIALAALFQSSLAIVPYVMLILLLTKNGKATTSPLFFLYVPWSFMFLMFICDVVEYTQKSDNIVPLLYMVSGLFLVFLGYVFSKKIHLKVGYVKETGVGTISSASGKHNVIALTNVMCMISIFGSLMYLLELFVFVGIDISSMALLRDQFGARETTLISQIANMLMWMSMMAIPAFLFLDRDAKFYEKLLWVTSVLLYLLQSVLSAGRQIVFAIGVLFIASLFIRLAYAKQEKSKIKKENKKYRRYVVILILGAIAYMMYVATARNNGGISDSKIEVLKFYFGCTFSEGLSSILSAVQSGLADGIAEAFVYFTHQIPEFTVFWGIPQIGPFFGLYSVPFIDRRLDFLRISEYTMLEKMSYVRNYMSSVGVMPVGWKTAFSYYILDYGKIGGLLFCILLGVVMGYAVKIFQRKTTYFSMLFLLQIDLYCFYTIMFPSTCETGLLFMLIFSAIMLGLENTRGLCFVISE